MNFIEDVRGFINGEKNFEICGYNISENKTVLELIIDVLKKEGETEKKGWDVKICNGKKENIQHDILWVAGVIEGEQWENTRKKLEDFLKAYRKESRSVAVALDTNILLANQVNRIMHEVSNSIKKTLDFEREPILLTTQGMEYEFHHQTESVRRSKEYPKELRDTFKLKTINYKARGRRGIWGRFMHAMLMARYPHLLIQSDIPLIAKIMVSSSENNKEGMEEERKKRIRYESPRPTSPYFDMVILEQLRSFVSNTNAVIIFFTADSDVSKIANQSGIKAFYVKRKFSNKKDNITYRNLVWIIVSMLVKFDVVYIKKKNGERRGYILCKNTSTEDVNLYIKKELELDFLKISLLDKLF